MNPVFRRLVFFILVWHLNPPKGSIPLNGKKSTFNPILQRGSYRGCFWHSLRTKIVANHESRMANFHFNFRVTYSAWKGWFLSCSFAKKKVLKECLKNSLKVAKRKSQTTNSNLQKFIILIWCLHFLYLSSGSLETKNHQGKIRNNITDIGY